MQLPEIDVYIKITTGLLGVAFPILFQVISKLDDKYASVLIVELLDNEKEKKWFGRLLVASLLFIFLWSLKLHPLFNLKGFLIDNSAACLILLSTTLLVVSFFFLVRKIMIYYTPARFIRYLVSKHAKANGGDFRYFKALSDVLVLSIQKQNENISQTISGFFYECFNEVRRNSDGKPVEYPDAFYSVVYKSIEDLAILKNKKNSSLEYMTAGGVWLLGEFQGHEISEVTYSWLWNNIVLSVNYDQDDMIMHHWSRAHQYLSYQLQALQYEYDENFEINNQHAIDQRVKERKRFLEFHYALGGLLLYKQRYKCIDRCFNYTQSQPPSYELLPSSMDTIFKWYMEVNDEYNDSFGLISGKYRFPEQSGIIQDSIIKYWVSSYLAVLFLRQYTIVSYLVHMTPTAYPILPEGQSEKRLWIEKLNFFKKRVSEILDNKELIAQLNLSFLTKGWCEENEETYPLDFVSKLIGDLENLYIADAVNLSLSEEKENLFFTTTKTILEKTLSYFNSVNNPTLILNDFNSWYAKGSTMVQSKDPFSKRPESHHLNFDSFLGEQVSKRVKNAIETTFLINKTHTYLLKKEDILGAIEKLKLDSSYLIISFSLLNRHFIQSLNNKDLSIDKFRDIPIVDLPSGGEVWQSLFIIKKVNLPNIVTKEISDEVIKKYSLKRISQQYNLYASVIDLNLESSDVIRKENSRGGKDEEMRKLVLLSIIQSIEIRWRKKVPLIHIIMHSEYGQRGLPNNLDDIIVD